MATKFHLEAPEGISEDALCFWDMFVEQYARRSEAEKNLRNCQMSLAEEKAKNAQHVEDRNLCDRELNERFKDLGCGSFRHRFEVAMWWLRNHPKIESPEDIRHREEEAEYIIPSQYTRSPCPITEEAIYGS